MKPAVLWRGPDAVAARYRAGRIITILLRFGMGGLFIWAGAMKALDPAGFLMDVEHYRLLPYVASVAVAFYLPWLEILAGACVLLKRFYPGALMVLLGLIVLFVGALISAWVRGLDISCGCFGRPDGSANYPWYLFRDVVILSALGRLFLLNFPRGRGTSSPCSTTSGSG